MKTNVWLFSIALCLAGCGYQEARSKAKSAPMRNTLKQVGLAMSNLTPASAESESVTFSTGKPGEDAVQRAALPDQRRIIYTAQVSLVVEDFSKTEAEVVELVKRLDGYIAESKVDRIQGSQRTGKWVVRIAVDKFDEFLDAVVELGVPENRNSNAQDVTEEFVDLEARLANKKEIERRVLKLLEERSGDIKDVIAVETELGRVREEIERMEGRLKYLTNRVSMTTVTINAREQQNYVPPQAPTFAAQIGQTWGDSLRMLKDFGQGLVLFVVGLVPWLPVIAIVVLPLVWLVRRVLKRPARLSAAQS